MTHSIFQPKPKPPSRYIPSYATGKARTTQEAINKENVASGLTPGASRTTLPSRYIPSYATGKARTTQEAINKANVASGLTPGASRTTLGNPDRDNPDRDNPDRDNPDGGGNDRRIDTSAPEYRDAEYNAQIASLNKALEDYEIGAQQNADRYGQDFRTGVQQMGFRPTGPAGFGDILSQEDPSVSSRMMATPEGPGGQWDLEGQYDPYSAAAKGTRGLRDDFAARGTLASSDFGQTFGEFQDRLDDQLTSMNLAKARFGENLQRDLASQRSNTEERRQATGRTAQQRAMSNQMVAIQRAMAGG